MRTILVPLDGSPFAEQALPAAIAFARRTDALLQLVSVHEPPVPHFGAHGAPGLDPLFDSERRAQRRAYLESVRDRLRTEEGVRRVESHVIEGAPADALVQYSQREHPDLVIIASHGRGGPSRFWLGSVTDRLVRALTTPVLVMRTESSPPDADADHPPFRRIVIPLDGSSISELALEQALEVGGRDGVAYHLLRVVSPLLPALGGVVTPEDMTLAISEGKAQAHEYLAPIEARLRAEGYDVSGAVRVDALPAAAICDYAETIRAGLIVMTTHARGPVGRALLGSVADKVVRAATAPVMVMRPANAPRPGTNGLGAGAVGTAAGGWWGA